MVLSLQMTLLYGYSVESSVKKAMKEDEEKDGEA